MFTTYWPSVRSVRVKYRTDVFKYGDERSELKTVQKQRSDISLVQTEQARSISSLLYGFTSELNYPI